MVRRPKTLRVRQSLGKYRIERRLDSGGFAEVYRAFDTIEGIPVALKIPHGGMVDRDALELFRREVRLTARLDHPNILPVKNADFIDGRFVIVTQLGRGNLADRLTSRLSSKTALHYAQQMLQALAHAHEHRIVHCDVKPENFILFPGDRLRLTDFGIAKVMLHTLRAAGTGTVGFLAPEQAMGRPSFRSDVFSLGVILYRMFSGSLPEWPYEWPPPGFDRLRRRLGPEMIAFIRRSMEVSERKRFADAAKMLAAFRRIRAKAVRSATRKRRRGARDAGVDWTELRIREFRRRFGRRLEAKHACPRCGGPVSETMRSCPWCGALRRTHRDSTAFPARCPRCRRGVKLDWRFCPWCYGPGIGPLAQRSYSDVRYTARCANRTCPGRDLMAFMRYCPWCRRKVSRKWTIEGSGERCGRCGWGILRELWEACPWCGEKIAKA